MVKLDPTVSTVIAAAAIAISASVILNVTTPAPADRGQAVSSASAVAADAPSQRPLWAASATGRVEPKDGEVRIMSQVGGKIVEVLATANDRVSSGDLLVVLDSEDLWSKLDAAVAEALVRVRERDEEPVKGLAQDRRVAEDAVTSSGQALFRARLALDEAYRQSKKGSGTDDAVRKARDDVKSLERKLAADRQALNALAQDKDMPLPSRLESSLTQARADVSLVQTAIERTRIRAPSDGSMLTVWAKTGEVTGPSADIPLALFGDLSSLRVRAEVEERDAPKIRVGQRVVIRADAYPERDFEGVVTQLAQALGPPRITTRGPRRPNDVEVLEVMAVLDGTPPLLTGMRVDVFFRHDASASAAPAR